MTYATSTILESAPASASAPSLSGLATCDAPILAAARYIRQPIGSDTSASIHRVFKVMAHFRGPHRFKSTRLLSDRTRPFCADGFRPARVPSQTGEEYRRCKRLPLAGAHPATLESILYNRRVCTVRTRGSNWSSLRANLVRPRRHRIAFQHDVVVLIRKREADGVILRGG